MATAPTQVGEPGTPSQPEASERFQTGGLAASLRRGGALLFFIGFFIVVGIKEGSAFLSWDNFVLVASQNSHVAFVACGLTFALIAGQFDLSVGALMGLCALLVAGFTSKQGMPLSVAIALVLCVGIAAGVLNGLLVTGLGVNAFIATLGTGSAFTGVAFLYNGPNAIFEGISPGLISAGSDELLGVNLTVYFVLALFIVAWALSRQTLPGRFFDAIGANPEASRLAGVRVERFTVLAFVVTGVIVALAGIVFTARFGSADPASGPQVLLPAFAAAFLGTALLSDDGRFTILGTILATFLIAWSRNALEVLGLNIGVKFIFDGAVLVAAVALSGMWQRRPVKGRRGRSSRRSGGEAAGASSA